MSKVARDTNRQDARFIVEHELFIEAFKAVEKRIIDHMKRIELTDASGLQSAAAELQLLHKVRSALTSHIATGDIADFNEHLSQRVS